ncbi:phage tail protein [Raoultibacter phocaeensis]|uniref:phage tail protein n=1 Tax=Raoultibacter phocaeensis TaxID=2479841 RepID=UPI00111B6AE2|nr:hypothetical protein [Raoultibacter phocaeensis]
MATDIGSAYLTVVPSLGDIQKQIEAQLASIDLSKSGEALGSSLVRGVQSSLSRLSLAPAFAQQVGPATESIQKSMQGGGINLDALSSATGVIANVLRALSALKSMLTPVRIDLSNVEILIVNLTNSSKGAEGGFKGLKSVLTALTSPLAIVIAIIAALAAGFAYLMTTNDGFRETVMGLVGVIGESLAPILGIVGQAVADLATAVLPLLAGMIELLLPVIGQICIVILQLVAALAPVVTMLVAELVPIIVEIIELVVLVASQILAAIVPVITTILTMIQTNMPMIQMIITTVMTAIMAVVQTVWPLIQAIIETAMGIIQSIMSIVSAAMAGDWQGVWEGILALVDTIWTGIQSVVGIAIGILQGAIGTALDFIQGIWDGAWTAIGTFLQGAWDGICAAVETGISTAVDFVGGLPDQALSALGDIGTFLYNAGNNFIQGFINGIKAAGDWVINAVRTLCDDALGAVKSFFGIASPSKVMAKMGGYIGDGLAEGISASAPSVIRAMDEVGADVAASAKHAVSGAVHSLAAEADGMFEPFDGPMRHATLQRNFELGRLEPSSTDGAKLDELIYTVRQLHGSLGSIIAANAPSLGRRDFRRVVNSL